VKAPGNTTQQLREGIGNADKANCPRPCAFGWLRYRRSGGVGDPRAAEAIKQIGEITLDGVQALKHKDLVSAGKLMDRNHAILTDLGVGHPALDGLVAVARRSSYGAKLTGAGGGGSIVALTDRPSVTAAAIRAAGGKAFIVQSDSLGVAKLG